MQMQHPHMPEYTAQIAGLLNDAYLQDETLLEVPAIAEGTTLTVVTMLEDNEMLKTIYRYAGGHDMDILEYTLHSRMIQDEDYNFITTLIFTFILIES